MANRSGSRGRGGKNYGPNSYEKYFQKWGDRGSVWTKYKEQIKEAKPHATISDEAVDRVVKTIGKYERFVKKKQREHKKEIKAKDEEIRRLMERIAELEKSNQSKDEQIRKLQEVDKRAVKNFKKVKAETEASFRGDKAAEKAGEKASSKKDTYERVIELIISRGKIHMTKKRANALSSSSAFIRAFKAYVDRGDITSQRLQELWALNFGEANRKGLTQYGLASDTNDNWDFTTGKVYEPKKGGGRAVKGTKGGAKGSSKGKGKGGGGKRSKK